MKNNSKIVSKSTVTGSTGKKYTVSKMKDGSFSCSCPRWVNTNPRKDCKHILSHKSGKPVAKATKKSGATAILSRKTTRAAVINLLLQNKNKTVAMPVVIATVSKVTGHDKKKVPAKISARKSMFNSFAKSHNYKFVASSSGLKFATA